MKESRVWQRKKSLGTFSTPSRPSQSTRSCGENYVDLGDIVQIIRDYQRAFMTEVAKARMVRSKGQYSLIQKYGTESDDEMAQELSNNVVGPPHSNIEERARQEREREEL